LHKEEISRRVLVPEGKLMTKKTQILPMVMKICPEGGAEPVDNKSYIIGRGVKP
jgi:hypothetical protein